MDAAYGYHFGKALGMHVRAVVGLPAVSAPDPATEFAFAALDACNAKQQNPPQQGGQAVSRGPHKPEIAGSIPAPATIKKENP